MLELLFATSVMTVVTHGHMSLQYPLSRNRDAGGNDYAVWKLNEPMIPARSIEGVCHGLPAENAVRPQNVFNAGEVITLDIEGSANHYGGHCAFWYSTDDVTFTKIVDVKDCTLSPQTTRVQLPENMPVECETRCTFAWTWTPAVSGLCEIYSNCADIRVNGVSGGYTDPDAMDFQNLVDNQDTLCQRVNEQTHWSNLFMPLKEQQGTFEPIAPSSPTTPAPIRPTTPAPTITPSPVTGGNIKVSHMGSVNNWWYAAKLTDVNPSATDVEMSVTTMTDNGKVTVWCNIDTSSGKVVYKCPPPPTGYRLPLDVRVWEDHIGGAEIKADGLITAFEGTYDLGGNFGGAPQPLPTPSPLVTPAPVTPAPVTPSPVTPDDAITMTTITRPAGNKFWYSAEVRNLQSPVFIDMLEVRSKTGEYNFCMGVSLSTCTVFECQPPGMEGYVYPLSVRMLGSNGQVIEAIDAIENETEGEVWNLGIQFSTTGLLTPSPERPVTPRPTNPVGPVTPAPVSPVTASPTFPVGPPGPVTPSPTRRTPAPSTGPKTPPPTRPDNPQTHDKEIIGYYPAWQWYDRDRLATPMTIDFSKYTIINFAFFQPDDDGYLFGTDNWADINVLWGPEISWPIDPESENYKCHLAEPQTLTCRNSMVEQGIIHRAHAAGAKIFPSLGGWTLSDKFPAIAADPVKRATLAAQCVELIKLYDFDGIDLDWEYPGYADHSGTPADTLNYNLLLQDMRDALDVYAHEEGMSRYYELTAALPCGVPQINDIDGATVSHLLDQFNLMTYDLFGAFSERTGANAGLYYQGWPDDLPDNNVAGCVANWRAMGVPDHKINIGLPFYGRSYGKAKGFNEEFDGYADTHWFEDEGVPQYYNIERDLNNASSNFKAFRHEPSWTAGGYFDDADGGFVSFDDQRAICDKVEYAQNEGLNGFIVWEITGDVRADLTTPLIDEVHMKLAYPDTHNCASADRSEQSQPGGKGTPGGTGKGEKAVKQAAVVRAVHTDVQPQMEPVGVEDIAEMEGVSTMTMLMNHLTTVLLLVILSTMCAGGCLVYAKSTTQNGQKIKHLEDEQDIDM